MSTLLVQRPKAALVGARSTPSEGFARRVWCTLRTWQRRDATRHHLLRLDDRLLDDMGMTREDVLAEAAKPFWRD